MNRRTFTAAAVATPLLTGCFWDKHFDLNWEEEIQLQDGKVIIVKLKHTYERLQPGFTRYGGKNILRDTTLTFDAGGAAGTVTQLIKGGQPLLLDQSNGIWYLVLSWSSAWSPSLLGGQDWGSDQNGHGQHVATLQGTQFKTISICALPERFRQLNFLFPRDDIDELSRFEGKLVSLQQKNEYLSLHPLGPGYVRIELPSPRSNIACKVEAQPTQGDNK